jgi:hypothetical protein
VRCIATPFPDTDEDYSSLNVPQFNHQWVLLPQREHILICPVLALRTQLHVKVVQHLGDDETHFVVRHASPVLTYAIQKA